MDLIEPGFRPLYEKVCVGNKGENVQSIFFEGMLLEEGFGTSLSCLGERFFMLMLIPHLQVVVSHGMAGPDGATPTTFANLSVCLSPMGNPQVSC